MKPELSEETIRIVQSFAEEIAHQIRNPLGSIELLASLLMKDHQREIDRRRIGQILSAVRLIDKRISKFMLSSKHLKISREEIDLNGLIREIVGYAERIEDNNRLFLSVSYGNRKPLIKGNREMLRHLFVNLIFHVLSVMPPERHLRIEISTDTEASRSVTDHGEGMAHVVLTVVSTGAGNVSADLSPLDIFFPSGQKSVGLGFSVLFSVIDFHSGTLSLREDRGGGISLQLSFPMYINNENRAEALQP